MDQAAVTVVPSADFSPPRVSRPTRKLDTLREHHVSPSLKRKVSWVEARACWVVEKSHKNHNGKMSYTTKSVSTKVKVSKREDDSISIADVLRESRRIAESLVSSSQSCDDDEVCVC